MDPNLPSLRERLFRRPEEPATELASAIYILDLFVVLYVITDHEIGALALPEGAPDALLGAAGEDTESPAILHHDDDLGAGIDLEALYSIFPNQVGVVVEFLRDIGELLRSLLFRRADEDDVVAGAEQGLGQDVGEGEGSALGMVARRYDFDL